MNASQPAEAAPVDDWFQEVQAAVDFILAAAAAIRRRAGLPAIADTERKGDA